MKKQNPAIPVALYAMAALCILSACALEPPPATPGAAGSTFGAGGGGKTVRVIINIAAPGEAAASRTLLPTLGNVYYKLEFARQGETEPALILNDITETTLERDIDPGVYTLTVTAYKGGTTNAVAGGSVPVTVLTGEATEVTVPLVLSHTGTGSLNYDVTFPVEITLTKGLLTLYPLSSVAASISIDLSAVLSGVETIPSGYYRAQLSIYGNIAGTGKSAAKTGVMHINDSLETTASYRLTADDFTDTELYIVKNSTELVNALTAIRGASKNVFTILASAGFPSAPISITDSGYTGKTITLRGIGDPREISLSSQGSLLTIGSASSEPVFILRDIVLKGRIDNNTSLLKVEKGELIMESGAVVVGNTNLASSSNGGGVYVGDGTFTIRGSASISGNTARFGGGVYIANGGTLVKNGGIIYGSDESNSLKNTAQAVGNAISLNKIRNRNATAGPDMIFTTGVDSGWVDADFIDNDLYAVENQIELDSTLNSIRDTSGTMFTILVIGNFSSSPVSLTDPEYNGKTITLSGVGGAREISLNSAGSLFTVGSASSEPVFVLQDITLKGIPDNTTSLLKVEKGELIMESGAIVADNTNSASAPNGGGVYVGGGTFTMYDNASVSGNTASSSSTSGLYFSCYSYGGGVYVGDGTFTMHDNASVSGNTASFSSIIGSFFYSYGGGVYVSGGTFTMQDNASVSGNTASFVSTPTYRYGGGVYVSGGTFTMQDNASVSGNTASYGGGVSVDGSGAFTIQDNASVSGNTASYRGGGVYVGNGTFTIQNNAAVSGNTADFYGGGVSVDGNGAFTMQDSASISGNMAVSGGGSGGGVYVGNGTFTMQNNALVSGNTAGNGGGVSSNGAFTMQDNASISGNTASDIDGYGYGGGVYVGGGTFTKIGGVIYGSNETGNDSGGKVLKNTTNYEGAAVFCDSPVKYRNTTVGLTQNLSTGSNVNWRD
jgi:hypothetical protein